MWPTESFSQKQQQQQQIGLRLLFHGSQMHISLLLNNRSGHTQQDWGLQLSAAGFMHKVRAHFPQRPYHLATTQALAHEWASFPHGFPDYMSHQPSLTIHTAFHLSQRILYPVATGFPDGNPSHPVRWARRRGSREDCQGENAAASMAECAVWIKPMKPSLQLSTGSNASSYQKAREHCVMKLDWFHCCCPLSHPKKVIRKIITSFPSCRQVCLQNPQSSIPTNTKWKYHRLKFLCCSRSHIFMFQ